MDFDSFNFCQQISAGITAQGFSKATPIQEQSIPLILEHKDLLGLAQTGSGKTAAFVLPILERLMKGQRKKARALIIAPTRELAVQIEDVISALGKKTGLKSTLLFGGVGINPQITQLKRGVEIVVACPGRLIDHMDRGTIDVSKIEMLVLDEADQMFDMGFLPAIRKIVNRLPAKRQTLLFSATMPDDVRKLANKVLTNPETVEIGRVKPPHTIDHALYPVLQEQKTELLLAILKRADMASTLVFTRTKHRAKRLALQLEKMGFQVAALQGNMSQGKRTAALEGFRKGEHRILVATDIAARGIDVSTISHVINYDVPSTAEIYTHRIGRTGRASRSGEAYTFVTQEDRKVVTAIEKLLRKPLARRQLEGFVYRKDDRRSNSQESGSMNTSKKKPTKTRRRQGPRASSRNRNRNSSRARSRVK